MKRFSGFSLMEIMIVLLIVSIVAAAMAPMINKKMLIEASDKSPWIRTTGANIAYNINGKDLMSATIGTHKPDDTKSRLHIETSGNTPQISLKNNDSSSTVFKIRTGTNAISINTNNEPLNNNSTVIGSNANAGESSVALGANANASHSNKTINRA